MGKNWGWILQNCWGFSTSFPLPLHGEEPLLEDDGDICQSITVETCGLEAERFNLGLPLPYQDRSAEDSDTEHGLIRVMVNGTVMQLPPPLILAMLSVRNSQTQG